MGKWIGNAQGYCVVVGIVKVLVASCMVSAWLV